MTRPEPLPDTWFARDLLVLREVARRVEADESLQTSDIADALGLDPKVVGRAGTRLKEDGYVKGGEAMGAGVIRFFDVTAKGRREVGQWPSPDAVDRLISALERAIDDASDDDKRSRLRRLAESVKDAPREVVTSILAAAIGSGLGFS